MSAPTPSGADLLSVEALFALRSLELRARTVAEGLLVGSHRSKRFGSSSEFAEHKLYAPGDELKHLDWRAYARVDRYFVRRYEEEANLDIHLIVDASGSMAYAGGARGQYGISKLGYATTCAGALAYLAHQQSDAAGISVFAGGEQAHLPPRARRDHLHATLDLLASATPDGTTDVLGALERLGRRMNRRALVVLFSDLLDVGEDALKALGVLRKRGADTLLLQVLDRDEVEFGFEGVVRFEDLEVDREVQVDAPAVRAAYLEEVRAWLEATRTLCARLDVRYAQAITDESPATVLKRALFGQAPGARR